MKELQTLTAQISKDMAEVQAEFAAKKAEFTKGLQERLHSLVGQAFVDDPNLLAICWTQYTPYFNDGDSCEFSMGEINALVLTDEVQDQLDDAMSIEEILSEDYYEGNVPYNLDTSLVYLNYLKTGVADFTGTYMANPYYDTQYPTVEDKINYYCSTQVKEYPKADETSIARLEANVSKFKLAKEVISALSQIPEEIMEDLFGDHVRVIITKDGIDVDSYDHD